MAIEPATWAALLAHWTDFARSALALPRTVDGDRWRRSVPTIIGLQAVTFALGDLGNLPDDEAALGRDRAEILIGRHDAELGAIWSDEGLPVPLSELLSDARAALKLAGGR